MKTTQKQNRFTRKLLKTIASSSHCASGKILNFSPSFSLPRCDMIFEIHPRQTNKKTQYAKEDERVSEKTGDEATTPYSDSAVQIFCCVVV